jgi:glycosyltransferase involved in cell wall biosynthesis
MSSPTVSLITNSSVRQPFARIAFLLAEGFAELGVRYDICFLEDSEGMTSDGCVRVVRLGERRSRGALRVLTRYLRRERPHMVLAVPGQIVPVALVAGRLAGVKVVPWEVTPLRLDIPTSAPAVRLLFALQWLGYPGARHVAVVSHDVAAMFPSRRPTFHLLPNPVSQDLAANVSRKSDGILRICSVGRLTYQKGFDVLLRALGTVNHRLPPWRLTILGTGPLAADLEALAEREGVGDFVSFAGFLNKPYEVMADSDVFVHPSRWEGFGVATLEAAALGLPIIATDSPGGTREILAGGAGILIPPDEVGQLADALVRVASDVDLRSRLAVQARRRARAYAPVRVAEQLLDIAKQI